MRRLYRQGAVSYQDMDDARLEYLNSQAAYDKAEADVNDTIVLSPMDGTIIGEPMKEGSTVSQGLSSQMIIATVADLSSMQIELLVDETDIGEVAVGQDVTFTVDAYPNRTFHGRVENISKKNILPQAVRLLPLRSCIIPCMFSLTVMNWMGCIRP